MALIYDVAQDFNVSSDGVNESASMSPSWVLAVIRFQNVVTYDRNNQQSFKNSLQSLLADSVQEAGQTLVITSDCLSLGVHQNKSSHVSNLTATLANGVVAYLDEIMPGDWVLAWMLQSETDAATLVKNIKNYQPSNYFQSGLKFIGRAQSLRKTLNQEQGGTRSITYNLQANGFTEFDSSIFFDPLLTLGENDIAKWYQRLMIPIREILSADTGGISANAIIPKLFETLLGQGLPSAATNPTGTAELQISPNPGAFNANATNSQLSTPDFLSGGTNIISPSSSDSIASGEAPLAYCIPATVGRLLNKRLRSKTGNVGTYADIVESYVGLQHYQQTSVATTNNPVNIFTPNGVDRNTESTIHNMGGLLGEFVPQIADFSDTNIWSVLGNFLNPLVNEQFTTLRVSPQGKILPYYIVRQLPFSTYHFSQGRSDLTTFLELPRWKIPPAIVTSFDIGRSNALRFNYVYLQGQSASTDSDRGSAARVRNPPIKDDEDIFRSGLRMSRGTVNCSITEQLTQPAKWMEIKADILMGMQLTLNGTITMKGIQAPIAVGDNLQFDGIVFHIESISHSCLISGGEKYFNTSIEVSNGLNSDPGTSIFTEYVGVDTPTPNTYAPGLTYIGPDDPPASALRVTKPNT